MFLKLFRDLLNMAFKMINKKLPIIDISHSTWNP